MRRRQLHKVYRYKRRSRSSQVVTESSQILSSHLRTANLFTPRHAGMLPLLPNTIRHTRSLVVNARRIRLHPLPRRRQRKQNIHILERLTRRLRATEPDVSSGHDTVQQRPDEDFRPDSVDARSTPKHHDPSGEPLARGPESSRNMPVLQRCDFGPVNPARAQPPDGEDDQFVAAEDLSAGSVVRMT